MSNKIDYVGQWHRVFRIHGKLIDFERMRKKENLCSKRLFDALANSSIRPLVGNNTLECLQKEYDASLLDSVEETAALRAMALWYTTDSLEVAKTPILDYGRDSERHMPSSLFEQEAMRRSGGGPGLVVQILDAKRRNQNR